MNNKLFRFINFIVSPSYSYWRAGLIFSSHVNQNGSSIEIEKLFNFHVAVENGKVLYRIILEGTDFDEMNEIPELNPQNHIALKVERLNENSIRCYLNNFFSRDINISIGSVQEIKLHAWADKKPFEVLFDDIFYILD